MPLTLSVSLSVVLFTSFLSGVAETQLKNKTQNNSETLNDIGNFVNLIPPIYDCGYPNNLANLGLSVKKVRYDLTLLFLHLFSCFFFFLYTCVNLKQLIVFLDPLYTHCIIITSDCQVCVLLVINERLNILLYHIFKLLD